MTSHARTNTGWSSDFVIDVHRVEHGHDFILRTNGQVWYSIRKEKRSWRRPRQRVSNIYRGPLDHPEAKSFASWTRKIIEIERIQGIPATTYKREEFLYGHESKSLFSR